MWCRCLPVKDAARRLQDSRRPADRSGPKPREYSTGVTAAARAAAVYLALGGHPVGAHAHLHFERRVHLVGAAHGVAQQGHALLDLGLGALEDELVVHLEDEPRAQLAPGELAAHRHHGHLDDVGGRALEHGVDRQALAQRAQAVVGGAQLRHGPAPPEQRGDVAIPRRLGDHAFAEFADLGVLGEVGVDERLGLLHRDVDLFRQAEGGEAVHDAEVGGLGVFALALGDLFRRDPGDGRRGDAVDVLAAVIGVEQRRLLREQRHEAQLDLRVVGNYEPAAVLGHETGADLGAQVGAHGDVLQVGIGAGEAPGGRDRLLEGAVHAPRARVDVLGQRLEVGVEQLGVLAPLLDGRHDGMPVAQTAEHARVGGTVSYTHLTLPTIYSV